MGVTVRGLLMAQWRGGPRDGDAVVVLDDGRTVEVTPSGPRPDSLPHGVPVRVELDPYGQPSDWHPAVADLAA